MTTIEEKTIKERFPNIFKEFDIKDCVHIM
jgi:hypothetical protein